jgi:hypothetical protein
MEITAELKTVEDYSGLKVAADEMKKIFGYQLDEVTAYKDTMKSYFGAASLVVTILASLQILFGTVAPAWAGLHQFLVILAIAFYIALTLLSIFIFIPTTLQAPIDSDWDVLQETYFQKNEEEVLRLLISSYLNAIDLNDKILVKLILPIRIACGLLIAIIACFAGLALLPKI